MKDDSISLFAYNTWANRRVLQGCRLLTPEQYAAEPIPGWSSARVTLVHIAVVTEMWLRTLAGEKVEHMATEAEFPAIDDAERVLATADQIVDKLLSAAAPEWFVEPRTFSRGRFSTVLPPWAILRHIVNHATYHRGQLASKLKRFGVEQPATDYVFWMMEQTQDLPKT